MEISDSDDTDNLYQRKDSGIGVGNGKAGNRRRRGRFSGEKVETVKEKVLGEDRKTVVMAGVCRPEIVLKIG